MRSFLTSLIPKDQIAFLFTALSWLDAIESLTSAPLLGLSLSHGIKLGGAAIGLPFFISSILYAIAGLSIWNMKPTTTKRRGHEEIEEITDRENNSV
jgi:hypothetical protein